MNQIEHQLKLHSEALQQKIEDLERDNEDNSTKNKFLNEVYLNVYIYLFYIFYIKS